MLGDDNILGKLLAEIKILRDAEKLLHKVWSEYGPYGDGKISDETRYAINDHFGFDDSE